MGFIADQCQIEPPVALAIDRPSLWSPWSLALPASVDSVYTAYFGVQRHSPATASEQAAVRAMGVIRQALDRAEPDSIEGMQIVAGHDMAGAHVQVAYWSDPDLASQGLASLDLQEIYASLGPWRDSVGLWSESFTTRTSGLNTCYTNTDARHQRPGIAQLARSLAMPCDSTIRQPWHCESLEPPRSGESPASRLVCPLFTVPQGYGQNVFGNSSASLVHVRAGLDWSDCGEIETAVSERFLRLLIDLGLDHLWSHPEETGAYGLRQVIHTDRRDRPQAVTGFAGFMRSTADLSRWIREYADHVRSFERLLEQESVSPDQRQIRSFQEISHVEPGAAEFRYVNCGPRTGVMRWVDLARKRLPVRPDVQ